MIGFEYLEEQIKQHTHRLKSMLEKKAAAINALNELEKEMLRVEGVIAGYQALMKFRPPTDGRKGHDQGDAPADQRPAEQHVDGNNGERVVVAAHNGDPGRNEVQQQAGNH